MMTETCSTCLSRGRILVSLDKTKYLSLFGSKKVVMKVESVCWECAALFHKLHKFKQQVLHAQTCLEAHKIQAKNLQSLSQLNNTITKSNDICCESSCSDKSTIFETDIIKTDVLDVVQIKSESIFDEHNKIYADIDPDTNFESKFSIETEVEIKFENDELHDDDEITVEEHLTASRELYDARNDDDEITVEEHLTPSTELYDSRNDDDEITAEEHLTPSTELYDSRNDDDEFTVEEHLTASTELYDSRNGDDEITVEEHLTPSTELYDTGKRNWNSYSEKNQRRSKNFLLNDYIIIKMTEEEMQAKREEERQLDRFKYKRKCRCDLCMCGFYDKEKLERHMETRHSEKAGDHECPICKIRFTKVTAQQEHTQSHYNKYQCRVCQHTSHRLAEMVAHDAREHGVNRFICQICHDVFPSKASLRLHRNTVHTEPVKCELCKKMFKTKDNLKIHHQVVHSNAPKSQCAVCGATCRNMVVHMQTHSDKPESAYCAQCDKRFSSMATYKNHLRYAALHRLPGTPRHACTFCDRKYMNSTGLKNHILALHYKVRPYKCDRCQKGFEAPSKLKLHILHVHEGVEKPKNKICHICGRGFHTKIQLSNHIRVHTGEKPFRCDECPAAFSQKSSLATHTRGVHLKIKRQRHTKEINNLL